MFFWANRSSSPRTTSINSTSEDVNLPRFVVAPALAVLLLACLGSRAEPAGSSEADRLFLDNGSVRLGVKRSSGAAIFWFSAGGSERNVINHWDRGRLLQQSYYGAPDGSMWDRQPWRWNPVQGGDWKGNPATVLELRRTATSLYARSRARHWASGIELTNVVLEEWITLAGRVARVRFQMTYGGQESHPAMDHEIPAVFVAPAFETLVVYDGGAPWTHGALSRSRPGWPNEGRSMAENWAAYVDSSGHGMGVWVPMATRLTCYRFGEGREDHGACSYFAPLTRFAITPGTVFRYEAHLTLGTVGEIRERFYRLHRDASSNPHPPAK